MITTTMFVMTHGSTDASTAWDDDRQRVDR